MDEHEPRRPRAHRTGRWADAARLAVVLLMRAACTARGPLRRAASVLGLALLTGAGMWVGVAFLGATSEPVGPVRTSMRLVPSWHGESVLSLPPLGTLELDTHDSPIRFQVTVDGIDRDAASKILREPPALPDLEADVIRDIRAGIYGTAVKSLVTGTVGGMLVTLIVARRRKPTLVAGAGAVVAILTVYGIAGLTLHPRAVTEPRYTGLLASAPSLIGSARGIAENFDAYSRELTLLTTRVTKLYDVASTLPSDEPDPDTIRVLHVSDLHLGEHAWGIIGSVTRQYSVDFIVDTGDITDHGLAAENYFLQSIRGLGVPYVWIRGNHDSMVTERAMRELPNAVVLDGHVRQVKGVRVLGVGDPRFTPDRSSRNVPKETEAVAAQAIALGKVADNAHPPADMLVFHATDGVGFLDGKAPLILTGDRHVRLTTVLPKGSRLMQQGTTGGAGLRALEKPVPAPIELSVIYLDRTTRQLTAWDEITLGGLGQTSARVERHQVKTNEEVSTPTPIPSPTGPAPASPLPTPTLTQTPPAHEIGSPSPAIGQD